MLTKIKRSLKYFVIFIGVIILLPTVLYLLLRTSTVQTFLVRRITSHFSNEIKSTISVGSVEYKLFNRLSLNNVLIKDRNNDTLLYSKQITAGIRELNFKNKSFGLGKVTLVRPVIALITDTTGQMNLTWFLDLLKGPVDTTKKTSATISINQVDINNARFSLINRTGTKGKTKINFNDLNLANLNGTVEDFKIRNDTTSFSVYNLGFVESSGFILKRMSSAITIANQKIILNSAFISCGNSTLNIARFSLKGDSLNAFKNFTEKVKLDIVLDKSLISSSDLSYFVPLNDSINESVFISGKILGTISELRGRDIKLLYRNYTSMDCDFDLSGLPKIENTYVYIGVNSLKTNAKDLEQIRLPGKPPIIIPESLKKLGNVSFNGSFTGFTTDFVTYGEIRTIDGNVRTDISLRPEKGNKYRVKGLLTGTNINIGELTAKPELLGNMSMKANVDGYAYSLSKFEANLTGKIDSIEFNKYVYRNITLNGFFTDKTWDGSINIVDQNIKLDLLGLLNFKNKLPEFDFTLNVANANLYNLHFDKLDSSSSVTMLLTSNFKGNNIDNLDGQIKLINSRFIKYSNSLELKDLTIKTYKEDNKPVLSLRSDFMDADIKGYYNFAALGDLFKSTLVDLMPSQFHTRGLEGNLRKNNFTFNFNFKKTNRINSFFQTGLLITEKSYVKGSIMADSALTVSGKADTLTIKNNVFSNLSFNASVSDSNLYFDLQSSSLNLLRQSELMGFSFLLKTKPDNFILKVNWDNKDQVLNQGNLIARGYVTKSETGKQNAILKVDIDSTRIYSDNKLWKLNNSSLQIDSSSIDINKLSVSSNDRYYMVDGTISKDPADTLHLEFSGIDISPLNLWMNRKKGNDPSSVPFDFKGHLNGRILISNVYKNLLLAGNIYVQNFSVLGSEFGIISINSNLDNAKKIVNITANNNLHSVKMFDITGMYDPALKKIELNAIADKLPLTFLNPLLKVFASDVNGYASGKIKFTAKGDVLTLQGAIMAEKASMKINYLQTKYLLNDSVRFDKQGIKFNNVKLTDVRGNGATLSGSVDHKSFKDYVVDLIITINSSSFQVLNTQPKDNPLFYGTAYASGVAKIKSDQNNLSIDVSAKTGKNSKLSIPLSKGLSVSEYSYISFEDSVKNNLNKVLVPVKQNTAMDLNMNLEVTPESEVQIIFDSKVGDVMKGHGSSENLNVNLNRKGDFRITGDYVIEDGEYTFTLGNIFNKPFSVENGGRIMFNGNLKDAEIDLRAYYLNLRAPLSPILGVGTTSTDENKYNERIRVEPQLNLSGKLFNPIVGFDIYLPDADEETRTLVRNAISTEDEKTKQVVSLLLMNSFISSTNAGSSSSSGTSAMVSTTLEMISSQVSNWLSQISKDVDIGFNIRPGYNGTSPQEAQLALSTQILNDKVVLNGNFDVRGAGSSIYSTTNQLTGDFDAELKLTERLRLKVFNRYNDTYAGAGSGLSPYTQGVGIFYKQDFNKLSDLFKKKNKADMKKEDDTKIKKKK